MGIVSKAVTEPALLLGLAAPALAANFATCLLDKLPGTANDVVAQAVRQLCLSENPNGFLGAPQGSGRGMFGYKSGAACTVKKAGDTRSNQAAHLIGIACRKLYDESEIDRFLRDAPRKPAS